MNVNLTPELEQMVKSKVESGLYNSASEVVRESLRLMRERDQTREAKIESLRAEIQVGIDQLDHGEGVSAEEVFAEIQAKSQTRKSSKK